MPRRPSTRRPRARKARKGVRKPKVSRALAVRSNFLQFSEVVEFSDITGSGAGLPASNRSYSVHLSTCDRAARIATMFRWYRIAKVDYVYQPVYNTFQATSGNIQFLIYLNQ